ncbi:MAG: hypothetical protein WAN96_03215 [Paludibacteraceae bacterium]|jgi:hypothetical protein
MTTTNERISNQYKKPLTDFAREIKELEMDGIPAPHIPIAGTNYDRCEYKMAFMGMETYGWAEMDVFMSAIEKDPYSAAIKYAEWLNPKFAINQSNPQTFFGFILTFLSEFYKIDSKQIKNKTNLSPVLTSYIWGETNAIERYEVTAKTKGVSHQVWQEVKKSSKRFDSINHIIEATKPKVVFILYKYVNKNYLFDINDSISFGDKAEKNEKAVFKYPKPDPECKYDYYFLREQQTHVFVLPHPRWIGMNGGHKMYAQSIIKFMENNKIWPQLPTKSEDWEIKNQNTDERRKRFIADIAKTLVKNNSKMYVPDLASLLNLNEIKTKYGAKYKGGRGTYTLIRSTYDYYQTNDPQTALNIARAFVKPNGEYAY